MLDAQILTKQEPATAIKDKNFLSDQMFQWGAVYCSERLISIMIMRMCIPGKNESPKTL